jgi:hypothetical protein
MDIETALAISRAESQQAAVGSVIKGAGELAQTQDVRNLFKKDNNGSHTKNFI